MLVPGVGRGGVVPRTPPWGLLMSNVIFDCVKKTFYLLTFIYNQDIYRD